MPEELPPDLCLSGDVVEKIERLALDAMPLLIFMDPA